MSLPQLRDELDLMPGPVLSDGQPSWTLHDPVRNRFFSLDWPTLEILRRWALDEPQAILAAIAADTTLHLEMVDIEQVMRFLIENQLVRPPEQGSARQFAERLNRQEGGRVKWLLHHYLFFRVPLVKPDAWLDRWQGVAGWFYSRQFAVMTMLALLVGLGQVIRHWEEFIVSLVDTFNWEGMAAYGLALIMVKLLHELGHAFTAKRFGCRIPSMGVAFLVLWPMAYTDTNETWRLTSRWQRLQVASAGIITELMIASWATLAWAILPDGGLRSAMFVLATTSWLATLAINASPFMRFDGYFILSDASGMPNLHERSFALARWKLRELLFALGDEKPEHFSPLKQRALILFAWAVWLYRLVVFLGIAVLVYHFFIKLIGLLLFAVELIWFIALPIRNELQVWRQRWSSIRCQPRSRVTAVLMLALLLLFIIPLPSRVSGSAMLRPTELWPVFAPNAARLLSLPLADGAPVAAGSVLLTMAAPELEVRRTLVQTRVERLRWLATAGSFNVDARRHLQSNQEELSTAEAELASIEQELAHYAPRAPFAGQWHLLDPDLKPGQWIGSKEKLALLVGNGGWQVETYLSDDEVRRVAVGDRALFLPDSPSDGAWSLIVSNIDLDAARVLPQRELAAQQGGSVMVRERRGQLIPEQAVYRVVLRLDGETGFPRQSWRGKVVIQGKWEAIAAHYVRNAFAVLLRETGF